MEVELEEVTKNAGGAILAIEIPTPGRVEAYKDECNRLNKRIAELERELSQAKKGGA